MHGDEFMQQRSERRLAIWLPMKMSKPYGMDEHSTYHGEIGLRPVHPGGKVGELVRQ